MINKDEWKNESISEIAVINNLAIYSINIRNYFHVFKKTNKLAGDWQDVVEFRRQPYSIESTAYAKYHKHWWKEKTFLVWTIFPLAEQELLNLSEHSGFLMWWVLLDL